MSLPSPSPSPSSLPSDQDDKSSQPASVPMPSLQPSSQQSDEAAEALSLPSPPLLSSSFDPDRFRNLIQKRQMLSQSGNAVRMKRWNSWTPPSIISSTDTTSTATDENGKMSPSPLRLSPSSMSSSIASKRSRSKSTSSTSQVEAIPPLALPSSSSSSSPPSLSLSSSTSYSIVPTTIVPLHKSLSSPLDQKQNQSHDHRPLSLTEMSKKIREEHSIYVEEQQRRLHQREQQKQRQRQRQRWQQQQRQEVQGVQYRNKHKQRGLQLSTINKNSNSNALNAIAKLSQKYNNIDKWNVDRPFRKSILRDISNGHRNSSTDKDINGNGNGNADTGNYYFYQYFMNKNNNITYHEYEHEHYHDAQVLPSSSSLSSSSSSFYNNNNNQRGEYIHIKKYNNNLEVENQSIGFMTAHDDDDDYDVYNCNQICKPEKINDVIWNRRDQGGRDENQELGTSNIQRGRQEQQEQQEVDNEGNEDNDSINVLDDKAKNDYLYQLEWIRAMSKHNERVHDDVEGSGSGSTKSNDNDNDTRYNIQIVQSSNDSFVSSLSFGTANNDITNIKHTASHWSNYWTRSCNKLKTIFKWMMIWCMIGVLVSICFDILTHDDEGNLPKVNFQKFDHELAVNVIHVIQQKGYVMNTTVIKYAHRLNLLSATYLEQCACLVSDQYSILSSFIDEQKFITEEWIARSSWTYIYDYICNHDNLLDSLRNSIADYETRFLPAVKTFAKIDLQQYNEHYWKPISFLPYPSSSMLHEIIQANRTIEEYNQPALLMKRSTVKNEIIERLGSITKSTRDSRFCPFLLGTSYRDWGFLPIRYDIKNVTTITTYINTSDTLNSIQRRRLFKKLQRQGYNVVFSSNQKAQLETDLFIHAPKTENITMPVAAPVANNDSSSKCPLIFGDVKYVDMAFQTISPTIINNTTYSFNPTCQNASQRRWLLSRLKMKSPGINIVMCEEPPLIIPAKVDVKQYLPDIVEKVNSHDDQVQSTCPSLMRLLKSKDLDFQTKISSTVKDDFYIIKAMKLSSYQKSRIQKKLAAHNFGLQVIILTEDELQTVDSVQYPSLTHLRSWNIFPTFIVKRKHPLKNARTKVDKSMDDNSKIDTSSACLLTDQIPQCKFPHEYLAHCYSENNNHLEKPLRSTALQFMNEEADDFHDFHLLDTVVDFFVIWRKEREARKNIKLK